MFIFLIVSVVVILCILCLLLGFYAGKDAGWDECADAYHNMEAGDRDG